VIKKKPQTLVEILGTPVALAIGKALDETYKEFPGIRPPPKVVWQDAYDSVGEAIDIFLNGRVVGADIVMYDKTPMIKVDIRHKGKLYRINKVNPLQHLISRCWNNGSPLTVRVIHHLLPMMPQDRMAMQMANIENASAAALLDPKKTDPIRERLAVKRAIDKEKLLSQIREVFKGHDDLISEEEILQLWRETMCAEVMDS
jgi:hypothetical protein